MSVSLDPAAARLKRERPTAAWALAVLGSVGCRIGSASTRIVHGVNTEGFVTKFADFWANPSPQRLPELLHPEVVRVQPLAARTVGIEAAQAQFQRIWRCLPDLHADVDRWCGDGNLVFIEFRMHARIGRNLTDWPNVNRLQLHEGKAIESCTYFDPLAILPALLRNPSIWWRWWRSSVTSMEVVSRDLQ
jgi:hypothetical protein